ncbi:hypothetical protein ESB00_18620 [Oleiharenicola lentus]|uniref:Alpha/beta hydrolase n=1 Tax=Oleiharenicola lentus TaxID=2508720 RepID=A0A4Q1C5L4_9BACT|nr:hypothetical protein [Oleiharenicola lentus]RXK53701.1 hypothetical protein ESB00_18620 [Oleiharenicola lentus]
MTLSTSSGRFAGMFRDAYLRSLAEYRFFYDDIAEIGNPTEAEHVFYFVPGINGTPGQMRFLLPSLVRVFGPRCYLKALHLPEFSARRPVWEKYTLANVDRKLARLRADFEDLLARFPRVNVLCSSNGFYDFAAAAGGLCATLPPGRLHLLWGACAPDRFKPTPWEKVFFPLNGLHHDGQAWFAYPNHNLLQLCNPETSDSFDWREGDSRRTFVKADLESRFRCAGLHWCYTSPAQIGRCVRHVVAQIAGPLDIPAAALVAANDGYWQGRSHGEIERVILGYLPRCRIDFRPASHLWVVTPTFATALLERLRHEPAHRTAATRTADAFARPLSDSIPA